MSTLDVDPQLESLLRSATAVCDAFSAMTTNRAALPAVGPQRPPSTARRGGTLARA